MVIKMKLAEALQERADLNRRIEQLNSRLYRNSKVQQGRNPEEDPAELISELDGCIARLEYLIAKINICNCTTKTPDGKSITELIAKRDCLKIKNRCLSRSCGQCKQLVRSRDPFRNCDFEHRGRSRASKADRCNVP